MKFRIHRFIQNSFPGLLFLGLLIIGGVLAARPVSATPLGQATGDIACKSVDVVVLVDQSESMGGAAGIAANDPRGERFEAAKTIVDYLGNHAVWLCQGQNIVHRIAVIGFGDNPAQPVNSGTPNPFREDIATYIADQVIPESHIFEDWIGERERIKAEIEVGLSDSLGATDHHAALEAARERLASWRDNPLGGAARRQAVILITDGEPCLVAFDCPPMPVSGLQRDMDAIAELTDPLENDFPFRGADNPDSVFISMIAMSRRNQNWQERVFSGWRQITQAHGGDLYLANDINTNLPTIVTDIVGPVAGSALMQFACDDEIWINPYTDNLVVIFAFGLDPQVSARASIVIDTLSEQIQVVGGLTSSPIVNIQDYVQDGRNEFYVLQRPVPGRYRLTYPSQDNCLNQMDVRVGKRAVTGEVVAPAADASFPATDPPSPIAAQKFRVVAFESVSDEESSGAGENAEQLPLVELDGYPLEIVATVNSEDGAHTRTYEFTRVEDGVYESTEVIASPVVGDYTWELVATVRNPNPEGQPIEVFRDSGEFRANEVVPFGFVISRPAEGTVLPLNTVNGAQQMPVPIPVAIDLVDANGDPTDVDTYLTDATDLFTASLLHGDVTVETIPLTRAPGSPSEFVGQFTNSEGGDVLSPGDYTIEVQAAWTTDRYDPLINQPANERAAVAVSQFEVVPLELRIVAPEDTTVHVDNWLGALQAEVRPVDFHIEVINAVTHEAVDLSQVLAEPTANYQAAVVPPSGNPSVAQLTVLSNVNFQRLVAEGVATDTDEAGEYQIKLDTSVIPLQDNFAWAGNEAVATFTRQDTTFSNPTVWRIIVGVTVVLVLLLLAWIIYSLTGGPTGHLALVSTTGGRRADIATFALRSTPRVNRLRNSTLANMGVKEIRVRRGPRDDDGLRTVNASATGVEGDPLLEDATMTENVNEVFLPDAELVYRTR